MNAIVSCVIKKIFFVSGLRISFLTQKVSRTLHGFFFATHLARMLERKAFSTLNIVFSFVVDFLDSATEYDSQSILIN